MKVLILAESGFGKSTSIGKNEKLGIEGLNPKETFIISTINRVLPFPQQGSQYKICEKVNGKFNLKSGNRVITNDGKEIATCIENIGDEKSPFKNIIIDDVNYVMQDFYMKNALKGGWDTPKSIGYTMGIIFDAMDTIHSSKDLFVMGHPQANTRLDGRTHYQLKTTGKMVDDYVTPSGKFDIVLIGFTRWDESSKKVIKEFVTDENETVFGAKSMGIFDESTIPNDLSIIKTALNKFRE